MYVPKLIPVSVPNRLKETKTKYAWVNGSQLAKSKSTFVT